MKQKEASETCEFCAQKGILRCTQCNRRICKDHAGSIKKQIVCTECFYKIQKKGLIKSWLAVGAFVIIAGFVIFLLA